MSQQKSPREPFFSIVIPTYNRANLILETLDSIFSQTYKNYEVIIVDNASTDNSIALLTKLQDEGKVRLIKNEKNLERSRARNIGIKAAKGDFVTLLDSDDFIYPNALKDAAEFIVKGINTDFFHCYYELVDNDQKPLYNYKFPSELKQIKKLAEGNFISCIGVFLSREVFQHHLFNEDEKILGSEDWELWVRVRSEYKLGVIPKISFGIRNHENRSISAYDLDSIVERKNYIISNLLENEKVVKTFGKFENLMRSSAYIFAAVSANQSKNFGKARNFLTKAIKINNKLILNPRFLRVAQIASLKMDRSFK